MNKNMNTENLGPAERVIATLLAHSDHLVHNRPGLVQPDGQSVTRVRWEPATHKEEGEGDAPKVKVAYRLTKQGTKTGTVRAGILGDDLIVREGGNVVASYRQPGIFPEVATWMWQQIAEVWRLDNEFAARWASHAFGEEHRDLKVALAAFMLVQSRKGDPVKDGDKIAFFDEDYRDVGEAMCLIRRPDGKDLNPKLLLRIHDLLILPPIAQINRELGFGVSPRNPTLGRWPKAVERWLRHREQNPKVLEGLVKAGFRTTVMSLARCVGYKPESNSFFRILRWKQKQSGDGRRAIAIGAEVSAAETWAGLSEADVCHRITESRPNWKRLVSLLPPEIGVTRAVVAAAVQARSMSDADLIILTPTLEDLGLLTVEPVKSQWERAIKNADNQRAANIATRVKKVETIEKLQGAADTAIKKAVEEVMRGLVIYFMVDISGSMENALEQAKDYVSRLLGGFPTEKVKVAVFNTAGREVVIKHASKAGVEAAFRGISAGGGTDYGSAVLCLQHYRPAVDEDVLFIFVGDEEAGDFTAAVRNSGLNPVAFGLLKVSGREQDQCVRHTAAALGIPCFPIETGIFNDPYSIPRALRNLIAATPVAAGKVWTPAPVRMSLVERILKTDLLRRPMWAEVSSRSAPIRHHASAEASSDIRDSSASSAS